MASQQELIRRQRALADFGDFVLDHQDLDDILNEGCRLIALALDTDLAKVIEIDRDAGTGLVRAGVGWRAGIVGHERVGLTERSSEAFAVEKTEPVITNDIVHETRFAFPAFLREHGVIALVNVPILLPGRLPWGVLQVDACRPRDFDQDDIEFLKTYSMVLGPVIDRLRVAEEREQVRSSLAEREERLSLAIEIGQLASWDWDMRSGEVVWNDRHFLVQGYAPGEVKPSYEAWLERVHPEDRAETVALIEQARDTASVYAHDFRALLPDGSIRWCSARGQFFYDAAGRPYRMIGVMEDVTERKLATDLQHLLLAELQHRVRNILAMVRSVARRSGESARSVQDLREHLDGRIAALARTQVMLTRRTGAGIDLSSLVLEELLAQVADNDRVSVDGPPIMLAPKSAEVLTLAVHELATNATKYGALADPDGVLQVTWDVEEENGELWLRLEWSESGVRHSPTVPRRSGFGAELIEKRVPYELQGRGEIELRPGGVRCRLEFPLRVGDSILETREPGGGGADGRH